MDKKMRFRFRAWNEFTKQFTYFNAPILWCAERIEDCGILFPVSNGKIFIAGYESGLEQSTGLKDNNEKLIYERDILKDHRGDICVVMWDSELASFMLYKTDMESVYSPIDTDITNFEIIGNIHENPELLEANNE